MRTIIIKIYFIHLYMNCSNCCYWSISISINNIYIILCSSNCYQSLIFRIFCRVNLSREIIYMFYFKRMCVIYCYSSTFISCQNPLTIWRNINRIHLINSSKSSFQTPLITYFEYAYEQKYLIKSLWKHFCNY